MWEKHGEVLYTFKSFPDLFTPSSCLAILCIKKVTVGSQVLRMTYRSAGNGNWGLRCRVTVGVGSVGLEDVPSGPLSCNATGELRCYFWEALLS